MSIGTVVILHPGEMGSTIGGAVTGGRRVLWASEGRSGHSARRAEACGLEDAGTIAQAVQEGDLILSVCPPQFAEDVAQTVLALGFRGIYADMNAISPPKAQRIGDAIESAGGSFVDGGIVGSPVRRAGTTRAYLSGPRASEVAACFEGGPLGVNLLEGGLTSASALKMAYASYSKISAALAAGVVAVATAAGVREALEREWAVSNPDLMGRTLRGLRNNAPKAWRFVPEMEEIAATYAAAGLPTGFQEAAAELYGRLEQHREELDPPGGEALIEELLRVGVEAR